MKKNQREAQTNYAVTVWWQAWTKAYGKKLCACVHESMYVKKPSKEVDGERSVCVSVACVGQKRFTATNGRGETELAGNKNIGNTVRIQQ